MRSHLSEQILEQAFVKKLNTHPVLTFFLTFLLIFLPFMCLAKLYGVPIFNGDGEQRVKVPHIFAWPPTWTAFGMASFMSLILAMEQYSQKQKAQIEIEFSKYFSNATEVLRVLNLIKPKTRKALAIATLVGFLLGCFSAYILVVLPAADIKELLFTPRPWFILVGITLVTFSVRLSFLTYLEHKKLKDAMHMAKLRSLYSKAPQSTFVRIALRRLLSWMLLIGLSAVFLVRGEDISIVAWPWICFAVFMSAFSFLSALDVGHKLILRHKTQALDTLNQKIQILSKADIDNSDVATQILAILALENRVQNIPEWTISMPIALRILSYFLIPLFTWVSATIVREIIVSSLR